MFLRRSISLLLTASTAMSALLAPAMASAASPPVVTGPTAAQLKRTSTPSFAWTLGPAGEFISSLTITPLTAGSQEEVYTERNLADQTRYVHGALDAGRYEWSAGWSTATGVTPWEYGSTAPQHFTVPPLARVMTIDAPSQANSKPHMSFNGDYRTNTGFPDVTCEVRNGRLLVAKRVQRRDDANSFNENSRYYCSLQVPESLDGKRLTAKVTVKFGRTVATKSRTFVAK